ncbi:alpha-xylosidase [uncultured Paraglaciecola sp.]|uniref:glycoside hydrolase family 31 protein n=1 Tax=uncultured Paraglaciecola sp. TaxID=1765024 RepID=UPI0030DD0195|tara:strand:- start:7330 stop:9417 length:2088 start_codon:yes stop_codon:yes gene_type:complete
MSEIASTFDVTAPNWNQIKQAYITGEASLSTDGSIVLPTSEGNLQIVFHVFGVRLRIGASGQPDYGLLVTTPDIISADIVNGDQQTTLISGDSKLVIGHSPFTFELIKDNKTVQQSANDGHFVRRYRLPPLAKVDKGWLMSLELATEEAVYGLGEKWGNLNKRGQLVRSYNHDALGVNAEISYKNTPFCWSPNGWGIFVHTPSPVTHAVGYATWSQRAYGVLVEDETLDIFIMHGDDGNAMINTYTDLTGKAPTPPVWSLGVILSKAYYKDVPELLATAKDVRDHKMPCDVITLDGRAWQDTDTRFAFEWDPKRFDDPAAVINQLKADNFKVCIWEYPLVSVQHPLFAEMAKKGWLLKDKRTGKAYQYKWDMSAFAEVLTPLPESGIVDFTHPDAYAFWLASHKPLFDLGIDMIKADFGEQVEDDNMLAYNGDSGNRLHNVYSFLYNKCVYEAAEKYSKNGPFLFSRSAWTGSQRFPSQWGGDPQADWGGLGASIRGALSWGLSGAPFFATDVGGFYKDTRDQELFIRWSQAAVFSAHMRLHGIGQREPWSYGVEAEEAVNQALVLRYRLLPYIYNAMQQATQTGVPLMRAMALAFPKDRLAGAFELQFMFGDDMLVVPCLQPGGDVEFYLPEGEWQRFPSEQTYQGGKPYTLTLGLQEMAVFVPKGKRIPLGPDVEHTNALTDQKPQISHYWPK